MVGTKQSAWTSDPESSVTYRGSNSDSSGRTRDSFSPRPRTVPKRFRPSRAPAMTEGFGSFFTSWVSNQSMSATASIFSASAT